MLADRIVCWTGHVCVVQALQVVHPPQYLGTQSFQPLPVHIDVVVAAEVVETLAVIDESFSQKFSSRSLDKP